MVSLDRDYLGGQLRDIMSRESKVTKLIKTHIEVLRAMSEQQKWQHDWQGI